MCKRRKPYFDVLQKHGVEVIDRRNSGHLVLKCRTPNGYNFTTVIPWSTSDWRSVKNFDAQIRHYVALAKDAHHAPSGGKSVS